MKNIFGYKKSSSRQSENRVCLVSLDEVGEKKMMATLSTIMDDTPHPHMDPKCPGQLLLWQAPP